MAIQFPAFPVNGQFYPTVNPEFVYNASKTRWDSLPLEGAKTITSDTAPSGVQDGDQWFNTTTGVLYIWVVDTDGGQWVESVAPISANGYYSPNGFINGALEVNQRAFTSTTSSAYGFDRWAHNTSGGTSTYSAQTFTLGAAPVSGYEFKNFARIVTSGQSTATDYTVLYQPIEGVRSYAGQTVTVSFWAKVASGTPKISIEISQIFGTGGTPSARVNTYVGQVSPTTSWARYSVSFTVPSILGKTIGTNNDDALQVSFWISAGSTYNSRTNSLGIQNNTFDFWGMQIEQGATATPFRRNANNIQAELAACQRYYAQFDSGTFYGWSRNAVDVYHPWIAYPVEMRVAPTVSGSYTQGGGTFTVGVESNKRGLYSYNSANNWGTGVQIRISATMSAEL